MIESSEVRLQAGRRRWSTAAGWRQTLADYVGTWSPALKYSYADILHSIALLARNRRGRRLPSICAALRDLPVGSRTRPHWRNHRPTEHPLRLNSAARNSGPLGPARSGDLAACWTTRSPATYAFVDAIIVSPGGRRRCCCTAMEDSAASISCSAEGRGARYASLTRFCRLVHSGGAHTPTPACLRLLTLAFCARPRRLICAGMELYSTGDLTENRDAQRHRLEASTARLDGAQRIRRAIERHAANSPTGSLRRRATDLDTRSRPTRRSSSSGKRRAFAALDTDWRWIHQWVDTLDRAKLPDDGDRFSQKIRGGGAGAASTSWPAAMTRRSAAIHEDCLEPFPDSAGILMRTRPRAASRTRMPPMLIRDSRVRRMDGDIEFADSSAADARDCAPEPPEKIFAVPFRPRLL